MKNKALKLPEGHFEIDHNCSTCVYVNWYDKDNYGRVRCSGGYGGYNYPEKRNGCFYWKG